MYGTKSAELHARVPELWGSPDILQCTLVSFPTIRFRFSPPGISIQMPTSSSSQWGGRVSAVLAGLTL